MTKTPKQLDVEIAEALASSPTARVPLPKYQLLPPKRQMYDINPSSPEVIRAFLKSGNVANEEGIQEFIAKRYAGWMRQYKKRSNTSYGDMDPSEVWAGIIREFTQALRKHGAHVVDD